jgi:hypothetical protein
MLWHATIVGPSWSSAFASVFALPACALQCSIQTECQPMAAKPRLQSFLDRLADAKHCTELVCGSDDNQKSKPKLAR